tara:strand:+ start:890 stop:1471 length:582 start_codon:yes stop_codon:yes gene_type:complete
MVDLLIDLTRRYNITLFFFKELAIFEKYMKEKKILDKEQIQEKIKRISYEIYEENFDDKSILVCGIEKNGSIIAKKIIKELESICDIKIEFMSINLNKKKPLNTVEIKSSKNNIKNKSIILIDDVSNTGKTLIYVIKELIKFEPKKINTAVLVNRDHTLFPIKINFVGLSLSTSIKSHIEVKLDNKDVGAYLI